MQASSQDGHVKNAFVRFQIPAYAGKRITSAALTVTRDNHHLNSTSTPTR